MDGEGLAYPVGPAVRVQHLQLSAISTNVEGIDPKSPQNLGTPPSHSALAARHRHQLHRSDQRSHGLCHSRNRQARRRLRTQRPFDLPDRSDLESPSPSHLPVGRRVGLPNGFIVGVGSDDQHCERPDPECGGAAAGGRDWARRAREDFSGSYLDGHGSAGSGKGLRSALGRVLTRCRSPPRLVAHGGRRRASAAPIGGPRYGLEGGKESAILRLGGRSVPDSSSCGAEAARQVGPSGRSFLAQSSISCLLPSNAV
jgi:hypothetical protein